LIKLPDIDSHIAGSFDPLGPGVVVAVVNEDTVLYQKGHGLANLEWNEPLAPDTVLALGSLTKPFTAQAVLMLELAGKLRIEESAAAYLPDLRWLDPSITVYQLLTHTSGIANYVSQPGFWERVARHDHTPAELATHIGSLKPDFPPGTAYSYSNSGYHLLGMLIEAVSEQPYDQYLRTAIFEPLGMTDTRFLWHDAVVPRRAAGYELPEDGKFQQGCRRAPYLSSTLTGPSGGLGSTLQDLLRWDASLRENHLLPAEIETRRRTPVALRNGRRLGYGLGWGLSEYRGRSVVHHAGGVPGFSSFFGHFVDDGLTIIAVSNLGGFDAAGLAAGIANQTLDLSVPQRTPAQVPTADLADAEGIYTNLIGERLRVTHSGERLIIGGDQAEEFIPLGDSTFASITKPDVTIRFEARGGSGYSRARVAVPFYWYVVGRVEGADSTTVS
jgi:CubicO group peptidase (beta-lactamase class C family)